MAIAGGTPLTADLEAAERDWTERRLQTIPHELGVLYRVEAVSYAYCIDPDTDHWGRTDPRLELFGYAVKRWTEHGATLKHSYSGCRKRWVDLRPGANQWASRTAHEAIEQFAQRRKRQLWILNKQTKRAERELALTDAFLKEQD